MNFNCKIIIKNQKIINIHFIYQHYQKPQSLLETLKNHNIPVNYQCKSGYCGICRSFLKKGRIKYYIIPLASRINPKDIFICCCFPIENITLKL